MSPDSTQRRPHATLDLASRNAKGLKIERLLDLKPRKEAYRVLEIGTGSGGIAHYFAGHERLLCHVVAIDVADNRQTFDGYEFQLVEGTRLPFLDCTFDVVISNHVIEHVGDSKEQAEHLAEMRRVLVAGGLGYLAAPSRWMVLEPHFGLPFLSWLPQKLADHYVRLTGTGTFYDCVPLSASETERLCEEAELHYESRSIDGAREFIKIERKKGLLAFIILKTPRMFLQMAARLSPTIIYIVRR